MTRTTLIGVLVVTILGFPFVSASFAEIIHVPADQPTIQAGIDEAAYRDIVLVAAGTYFENIDFDGKVVTIRSEAGPDVTVIDGGNDGTVVVFDQDETSDSILDGFTIQHGAGDFGGGISICNASPTIVRCVITNNWAHNSGGGIRCAYTDSCPTILDCTISGNSAYYGGGGIYCSSSSSPMIIDTTISDNEADDGGGIYLWTAFPTIVNCTISGNTARSSNGGGIYCSSAAPIITNCVITGNSAKSGGGIIAKWTPSPVIKNCTITENSALNRGGGIEGWGSEAMIENSILWGNSADGGGTQIFLGSGGTLTVGYSDVQGGQEGAEVWSGSTLVWLAGNINANPLFVDNGDFHLQDGSPCVDTGNPDSIYDDECFPPSNGTARNDMGAYGGPDACCWGRDLDGDGYIDEICGGLDCDDTRDDVSPGALELCNGIDNDCDGLVDDVDMDGDGFIDEACEGDDCDDNRSDIHPGATELCDGLDYDCDDIVDNRDEDSDGHIDEACGGDDCDDTLGDVYLGAPELCDGLDNDCNGTPEADEVDDDDDGWMICAGDCDDEDPDLHPAVVEICDHIDNDCDDVVDDGFDVDEDGFSLCAIPVADCDDTRADVYPGAPELCDGLDNDCGGSPEADEVDDDGDGWMVCAGDCDDADPDIHPAAQEGPQGDLTCSDGVDNNCDGFIDMGDWRCSCWDNDGDGYLDETCGGADCDDADGSIHPAADEICDNGVDDDCDGLIDTEQPGCRTILVPSEEPTIQDAVDIAVSGDTVLVAPGTYVENVDLGLRAITLRSTDGAEVTIIDGSESGSVVFSSEEEFDPEELEGDMVIDGFTIRNGDGSGAFPQSPLPADGCGGGIFYFGVFGLQVRNCIITGNQAIFGGGIAYFGASELIVDNCRIRANSADGCGGIGLFGIGLPGGISASITNCEIEGNVAVFSGGGICGLGASLDVSNCAITSNSAAMGGGIVVLLAYLEMTNCTLFGNVAFMSGGGIYCLPGFSTITNSILWNDMAPEGPEIILDEAGSEMTVSHTDVQGGEAGVVVDPDSTLIWLDGNIDADPLFAGVGDYHLADGSPCIDAGDPDPASNDLCFPPSMGTEQNDMGAYGGPGACGWVPQDCWDMDGDGYLDEACDGDDCDDADPEVSPGHEEIPDNGVDDDCDGQIDESCFIGVFI